jgi:phosphoserine phosphatase
MCHKLVLDAEGFVTDYTLRQANPKTMVVNALKGLNDRVIAAGDSFNDTGMLGAADAGFFMRLSSCSRRATARRPSSSCRRRSSCRP